MRTMPKNIVICCDGTSNRFGKNNTNVVRLVECLAKNTAQQVVFYDPGVGTLPQPGLSNPVKWLKWKAWTFADLAVGWGLEQNVEEAYRYLMNTWQPGDRVFLFGFSRGAYTVRVLAGLLHGLGLLRSDNQHLIPYLLSIYKSIDAKCCGRRSRKHEYWRLCAQFRRTFARDAGRAKRFPIYFIGLWDTVSSYGWLWNPQIYTYTANNPGVSIVRHAVSIDERRAFFRQNLISESFRGNLDQRWFPGVHCDVGGGYREADGGLWRVAFAWMVSEAEDAGLLFDAKMLNRVLTRSTVPDQPWSEPKHSSLLAAPHWWIAEFIPKLHPYRWSMRLNLFHSRTIPQGASIDRSALERVRHSDRYRPRNFSKSFVAQVIALRNVPDSLPYDP